MAGIGFELKKIFRERSVLSLLKGAFYSTFTVVGPMLIIIIGFLALNGLLDYRSVSFEERDLLSSIVIYVFIFSLVLTSPFSAVISRYVADKIFDEHTEDIMPCYYAGLIVNLLIGVLFCVPFAVITVYKDYVDALIMFAGACMFFALFIVFYTLTFVSALKEYKSIALSFIAGILLAMAVAYVLKTMLGFGYVLSVVIGAALGFTFIAFILFSLVRTFFPTSNQTYGGVLKYLRRHKLLFLTNLFYILGLYIHNFIFWFHPEFSIVVARTFRSAPIYDTATFLAMLTNVSATVIYTVRVEINFHDRYQIYCQELIGGISGDIERAETNMFKTLSKELMYITHTQLIFSVVVYLIIMMFGSSLGFGGMLLSIYPGLAAGYFVVFIMYGAIIFLYYFNDGLGAFISSLMFFVITTAATYLSSHTSLVFYGIGPFFGALAGWATAFFRLKYLQKNIKAHIYCRGEVIKRVRLSKRKKRKLDALVYHHIMPNALPDTVPAAVPLTIPAVTPAAIALETPAAIALETPAAIALETPAAIAVETPAAIALETPAAIALETPAAIALETPAAIALETPAAISIETPAAIAIETPAAIAIETPAAIAVETPAAIAVETPAAIALDAPAAIAVDTPFVASVSGVFLPMSASISAKTKMDLGAILSFVPKESDMEAESLSTADLHIYEMPAAESSSAETIETSAEEPAAAPSVEAVAIEFMEALIEVLDKRYVIKSPSAAASEPAHASPVQSAFDDASAKTADKIVPQTHKDAPAQTEAPPSSAPVAAKPVKHPSSPAPMTRPAVFARPKTSSLNARAQKAAGAEVGRLFLAGFAGAVLGAAVMLLKGRPSAK